MPSIAWSERARAPTAQMSSGSCSTQPGLRIDLAKLLVAAAADLQLLVEDEHGGAGGALVDRDYVAHARSPRLSIRPHVAAQEVDDFGGDDVAFDIGRDQVIAARQDPHRAAAWPRSAMRLAHAAGAV